MTVIRRDKDAIKAAQDRDKQQADQASARAYLAETDWLVIRYLETGTRVPADVTAARANARLAIPEKGK